MVCEQARESNDRDQRPSPNIARQGRESLHTFENFDIKLNVKRQICFERVSQSLRLSAGHDFGEKTMMRTMIESRIKLEG